MKRVIFALTFLLLSLAPAFLSGRRIPHAAEAGFGAEASGGKPGAADPQAREGVSSLPLTFPIVKGRYFGQKPPGMAPEIFAPGIISTPEWEFGGPAFSPDGREIYWSVYYKDKPGGLLSSRLTDVWSAPAPVFTDKPAYFDSKPALPRDGRRLIFASGRPVEGLQPEAPTFVNLWMSIRKGTGWGAPFPLGNGINTRWDEDFPTLAADGTLYFSSNRPGGPGFYNMYYSRTAGDAFGTPELFTAAFATTHGEAISYVAPDRSYLIFMSLRPGGIGSIDLYISFRDKGGIWGPAISMGDAINSPKDEQFAAVSPDGRYLFFTSNRTGNFDIYWVDAKIIDRLRPQR